LIPLFIFRQLQFLQCFFRVFRMDIVNKINSHLKSGQIEKVSEIFNQLERESACKTRKIEELFILHSLKTQ